VAKIGQVHCKWEGKRARGRRGVGKGATRGKEKRGEGKQ